MRALLSPRLVTIANQIGHQIKKIFLAHSVSPQPSQITEFSNLKPTLKK